jgi:hypothetical protein
MNPVESYIYRLEGEEREIISYLHDLLTQRYEMSYKIRYRVPFYDIKKWLCYLNIQKKGGVELCFLHGRWMADPQGALDAKGRVQIYGITYRSLEQIDEEVLQILIEEAIEIDEKFSKLKRLPK